MNSTSDDAARPAKPAIRTTKQLARWSCSDSTGCLRSEPLAAISVQRSPQRGRQLRGSEIRTARSLQGRVREVTSDCFVEAEQEKRWLGVGLLWSSPAGRLGSLERRGQRVWLAAKLPSLAPELDQQASRGDIAGIKPHVVAAARIDPTGMLVWPGRKNWRPMASSSRM